MNTAINFYKYSSIKDDTFFRKKDRVENVVGLTIESAGPEAKLGDLCVIYPVGNEYPPITAEVVGFKERRTLLMPCDKTDGIGLGCIVENTGNPLTVPVSDDLLGKVLDGLGRIDGEYMPGVPYSVEAQPPDAMSRKIISEVLPLGVKAIDGLMTVGKGQRIGIFAGSGVGKSTLMGMFARNTRADINVIALIGERGREVREFVERDLGEEGMRRSVVVVATSDKSRGYPPSVYSEMPRLLERAGCAATGSITGLYTVLVDGDDMNEPITDTARSILDGHIMLNRRLAHQNHYPAIDVLQSISRCMSQIVNKEHKTLAGKLKNVLATYNEAEDLINIGAYKSGSNRNIDYAIAKIEAVNDFLMQDVDSKYDYEEAVDMLRELFAEAEDADAE